MYVGHESIFTPRLKQDFSEWRIAELKKELQSADLKKPGYLFLFNEIKENLLAVIESIESLIQLGSSEKPNKGKIDEVSLNLCRNIFEANLKLKTVVYRLGNEGDLEANNFLVPRANSLLGFISGVIRLGFEAEIEGNLITELGKQKDQFFVNNTTSVSGIECDEKAKEILGASVIDDLAYNLHECLCSNILPLIKAYGIEYPIKFIKISASISRNDETNRVKSIFEFKNQTDKPIPKDLVDQIRERLGKKLSAFINQRMIPVENFQNIEFNFEFKNSFRDQIKVKFDSRRGEPKGVKVDSKNIRKELQEKLIKPSQFKLSEKIQEMLFKSGGLAEKVAEFQMPIGFELECTLRKGIPMVGYSFKLPSDLLQGEKSGYKEFLEETIDEQVLTTFSDWYQGAFSERFQVLDENLKEKFTGLKYSVNF